ncbi:MAG: hypothetical protein AAF862_17620, partial [Pseudomonadota bacterium]
MAFLSFGPSAASRHWCGTALLCSASSFALVGLTGHAFAQCAPDPAEAGDQVVCSGIDPDGIFVFQDNV